MPRSIQDASSDLRIVCKTLRAEQKGKVVAVAVRLKTGRWGVTGTGGRPLTLDTAQQARRWLRKHWPDCRIVAETVEID